MTQGANILPLKLDGVVVGKIEFDDDGAHILFKNKGTVRVLEELRQRKQIQSLTLTIEPSPDYTEQDLSLGHLRVVKGL